MSSWQIPKKPTELPYSMSIEMELQMLTKDGLFLSEEEIISHMQKLVEDAACLPLWFGRTYILVKPYVKGYTINPLGFASLNQVTIEPH